MASRFRMHASALLLVFGLSAGHAVAADDKPVSRHDLNLGYSLLYQEARGLAKMKYVVAVKEQNAEVEQAVKAMTDYCAKVQDEFEKMKAQYPGLQIDLEPMSKVQANARIAMGKERVKGFLPVVGQTGLEYERNLMLMMGGGADEESEIAGAIADLETDAGLKRYALGVQSHFHELSERFASLLDRRYFAHPAKTRPD